MNTRNMVLVGVAFALVAASVPAWGGHSVPKDYFTAGAFGDYAIFCGVEVADEEVSLESEAGYCLGGNSFDDVESGDYRLSVVDHGIAGEQTLWGAEGFISGAYRVETESGAVVQSNVDTCFRGGAAVATGDEAEVPQGASIAVWIDGVVWWGTGIGVDPDGPDVEQVCGLGQLSQGTFGTITLEHD